MNTNDEYLTIKKSASAKLKVKDSIFIAFIHQVKSKDEVSNVLKDLRK